LVLLPELVMALVLVLTLGPEMALKQAKAPVAALLTFLTCANKQSPRQLQRPK
jgi:hypothetical protein